MTDRKLKAEVEKVHAAIFAAIPAGVSFAAIIIALAQLIQEFQEQAIKGGRQ